MAASAGRPKVTGQKITNVTVPLFPDKESELRSYGDELANYLNDIPRTTKWLPRSDGALQMLRRWASRLPEPSLAMLKEIASHTQSIQLQSARVVAPIRGKRIEPTVRIEMDVPTPVAGVAYLLATILSAGYGNYLRQCVLDDCDIWFFDVPEGRPPKEYCGQAHSNVNRQRKWRERIKAEQRKRRR